MSSLQLILPALHNLAKKAVTERLAAAIFELMVVVHSLFDAKVVETVPAVPAAAEAHSGTATLALIYDKNAICEHLNIVIDRVINIHEHANNIATTTKATCSAAVLRKRRRRAITLDPAMASSLIPHLPTLLSNPNTTVKQQLQLLPVVLRWTLSCDAVDARISLLDSIQNVLQQPALYKALRSTRREDQGDRGEEGGEGGQGGQGGEGEQKEEYTTTMLMASVDPVCQLVERSLEAPVLGSVLEVVLGLTSVMLPHSVPKFLAKVLPSVAKRLKQAAPQVRQTCVCVWCFVF